MSERTRRGHTRRDTDGTPLIDAGVLRAMLGMTPAGARKWATRHHIHPVCRGSHGAFMYRLADVYAKVAPDSDEE